MISTDFEVLGDFFDNNSKDCDMMCDNESADVVDVEELITNDQSDVDSLWGNDSEEGIPFLSSQNTEFQAVTSDFDVDQHIFDSPMSKSSIKGKLDEIIKENIYPSFGIVDEYSDDGSGDQNLDELIRVGANKSKKNKHNLETTKKSAVETEVEVNFCTVVARIVLDLLLQAVKKIESGPSEAEIRRRNLIEM